MLEIVLVRHGQSEGNRDHVFTGHSPSPLTELGRRQAVAVAERLAKRPVSAIYSSDLPRAIQTAEPLVQRSSAPFTTDNRLRERDIGDLTGVSFAEVEARMPEVWRGLASRDPTFRPPGGESTGDCRARMSAFLEGLYSRNTEAHGLVVLVSHGIAINQMLNEILQFAPDQAPPVVFQVENCSFSRFERRPDGTTRIMCINDTAHLASIM